VSLADSGTIPPGSYSTQLRDACMFRMTFDGDILHPYLHDFWRVLRALYYPLTFLPPSFMLNMLHLSWQQPEAAPLFPPLPSPVFKLSALLSCVYPITPHARTEHFIDLFLFTSSLLFSATRTVRR